MIHIRSFILILIIISTCFGSSYAQKDTIALCPVIAVTAKLEAETFKVGEDIPVTITLTNRSNSIQSVWFDKPKLSTGGPVNTSVVLTNKKTGASVLKYQDKSILHSQLYTAEQVKSYSYQLKPGQQVSGEFSLYDLVVLLGNQQQLDRGSYEMQLFFCLHSSHKLQFTVE